MIKLFDEIPRLEGETLVLGRIRPEDLDALRELTEDDAVYRCWGQGIATEAVALMAEYLFSRTDIEIITASTMVDNIASARVLEKNGFTKTASAVSEDWGYCEPTAADKWFR